MLKFIVASLLGPVLVAVKVLVPVTVLLVTLDPRTSCRVPVKTYEQLLLERPLEQVATQLGCPGALLDQRVLSPDLTATDYAWRSDHQPLGVVVVRFYNSEAHAKYVAGLNFGIDASELLIWLGLAKR